jgi:alanine-glyoxylate transaminase/serine-glyoxylate transaminase/serine-pyruvate transaminase
VGGRYFVQNPGPTNIPDRILEAFRRPAVDFADPDFIALAEGIWTELPEIFGGADKIVVLTAVGHGAWESTLTNTLDPGDAVLIPDCGLFGRRWARMARELGYEVVTTESHIRRPTDPAEIAEILEADTAHRIRSVCIVHTETSTGAVTDLAAMRAAIDAANHPAIYVVDGVCSLGIEPLRMRDWGIDVVVAASQKGLMMPPGLSFCALSERAVERNRSAATPRFHLAWAPRFEEGAIYNRFGGTPPIQHMFALRTALDMIAETGGIDGSIARHRRWAAAVHAAVDGWASGGPWEINVVEPKHRTAAITCVRTGDIAATPLIAMARDRFRVSVGSGMMTEMEGRGFRIGHLGDLNEPMLLGALGGLETAMTVLGLPHGHGLPAAVASLAATARQAPLGAQDPDGDSLAG